MCQSLRPATLRKKRFQHWYFSVNFAKFLRTTFFYRTPLVAASEISFGKSMLGFVKHLSTWKVSVFSPNSGKLGPEKFQVRTLFTNCLLLKVEIKLVSCILLINVRTITIISGVATDALANSIMTNTTISTWIDMTFILNYNKNEKRFYCSRKSFRLKSRTLSTKKWKWMR